MKKPILFAATIAFLCSTTIHADESAPSSVFDLRTWKLGIPGPQEIIDLQNYSSKYFDLNSEKEMCFHLDAAEKGPTTNAHFVRSELRHLPQWKASETHSISVEVRVVSHLKPDKLTVVQIHGITPQNTNAPPLLRVAVDDGDLVAHIKTTNNDVPTDHVLLLKGVGIKPVKIDVTVEAGQMKIHVNGEEKLSRSLAFWTHLNYFKAGCYPQATEGTADVMFRKLTAR